MINAGLSRPGRSWWSRVRCAPGQPFCGGWRFPQDMCAPHFADRQPPHSGFSSTIRGGCSFAIRPKSAVSASATSEKISSFELKLRVERAVGDTRSAGDVADVRIQITILFEQRSRRLDERGAGTYPSRRHRRRDGRERGRSSVPVRSHGTNRATYLTGSSTILRASLTTAVAGGRRPRTEGAP